MGGELISAPKLPRKGNFKRKRSTKSQVFSLFIVCKGWKGRAFEDI